MELFKEEDGWSKYYHIADSDGMQCGTMECSNCGVVIQGLYLVEDVSNYRHRGNETDRCFIYHKSCSPSTNAWEDFEKEQIEQKLAGELYRKRKKEILELMRTYDFEIDDLY